MSGPERAIARGRRSRHDAALPAGLEKLAVTLLRGACRMYPRPFRHRFAADLVETFAGELRDRAAAATRPRFVVLRFAAATLLRVVGDALGRQARNALPASNAPRVRNGMDNMTNELRYAARTLRRSPAFTVTAVLTLALAIGANTAVFSIVDTVLLRPLPYDQPERLMVLWERHRERGRDQNVVHPRNYEAWMAAATSFDGSAVLMPTTRTVLRDGERMRVPGAMVSPEYFSLLGIEPLLGRWFTPDEGTGGGADVVMLSHALWQAQFGGDPEVVGRSLILNDTPHAVVGVMPAGFLPPRMGWLQEQQMWLPIGIDEELRSIGRSLIVLARLGDGVSAAAARAEMAGMAATLAAEEARNEGWDINPVTLHEQVVGAARAPLSTVLAAVALVLLMAATNVAGLILARAHRRRQEFAVRSALGAGGWRLARQLVTEGLLLTVAGGCAGMLLGAWLLDAARPLLPASLPRLAELQLHPGVLALAAVASLLTVLATGLLPALRVYRDDLRAQMTERAGRRSGAARRALVVAEVALAVVLTVGAGLMVRSFRNMSSVELGFEPANVTGMRVSLAASFDGHQRAAVFTQILAEIEALPGVAGAATMSVRPLGGLTVTTSVDDARAPAPEGVDPPSASIRDTSAGVLEALGMELVGGRALDHGDRADLPPRVLISRELARQLWPSDEATGNSVLIHLGDGIAAEVVGVFDDARLHGPEEAAQPTVLRAMTQFPSRTMDVLVRGGGAAPDLAALRSAVLAVDPAATIYDVATLDDLLEASSADRRFTTLLLAAFALIAVLLAAIGVYGVLASDVALQRRDTAVRVALGARAHEVLRRVVAQGMGRATLGIALGIAAAAATTRSMAGLLFGVSPTDAPTFAAVSLLLLGVALLATLVPALRALRVDPVVTMRSE